MREFTRMEFSTEWLATAASPRLPSLRSGADASASRFEGWPFPVPSDAGLPPCALTCRRPDRGVHRLQSRAATMTGPEGYSRHSITALARKRVLTKLRSLQVTLWEFHLWKFLNLSVCGVIHVQCE